MIEWNVIDKWRWRSIDNDRKRDNTNKIKKLLFNQINFLDDQNEMVWLFHIKTYVNIELIQLTINYKIV